MNDAVARPVPVRTVRAALLGVLLLLYGVVFVALDGLRFPLRLDEVHFWKTALGFSGSWIPSAEQLRTYRELNTPLPFLLWGALEHAFGAGVIAARLTNYVLSLGIVAFLAFVATEGGNRWGWVAPVFGVLSFPYYLGVSSHAYTDVLPAALCLLGVYLHLRGRHWPAALVFALAISARQYAVAFPAALCLYEIAVAGRPWARPRSAWVAPALAAATLGGWYLFFGGFGPALEIASQRIQTVRGDTILVRNSLYFLACAGLYFVVPMVVLTRTRPAWRELASRSGMVAAAGLLALFVLFPPLQNENFPVATMGFFDRALRLVLPDAGRVAVFYLFALLALAQLRRRGLAFVFLLVNAALMAKAHIAWDKYLMPLLVVLWLLEALSYGREVSGAAPLKPSVR